MQLTLEIEHAAPTDENATTLRPERFAVYKEGDEFIGTLAYEDVKEALMQYEAAQNRFMGEENDKQGTLWANDAASSQE